MFNDNKAIEVFASLVERFGITSAIETGTHFGHGSIGMNKYVRSVGTIEVEPTHRDKAIGEFLLAGYQLAGPCKYVEGGKLFSKGNRGGHHIRTYLGSSQEVMDKLLPQADPQQPTLFYLDAHWGAYWPLLDELKVIAKYGLSKSVIIIHDAKNPNRPEYAFDNHGGKDLDFDYVKDGLAAINPNFKISYNMEAEGNKRGILYALP